MRSRRVPTSAPLLVGLAAGAGLVVGTLHAAAPPADAPVRPGAASASYLPPIADHTRIASDLSRPSTADRAQATSAGSMSSTANHPQAEPILGAALTILADGTQPWEDRPLSVAGLGTLPGVPGQAAPGDDPGPNDLVVRAWDAVIYRASFSVRDAPATDVVAEVMLSELAIWEPGQLDALELAGCPGGASLSDGGRRLRCQVGRVEAPPAVTVALDLTVRVSGGALQGDMVSAAMTVRAPGGVPDPDVANCPVAQANGCDAAAPTITVSAAPAA